MKGKVLLYLFCCLLLLGTLSCEEENNPATPVLRSIFIGSAELNLQDNAANTGLPTDRALTLNFSAALNPASLPDGVSLQLNDNPVNVTISATNQNQTVLINPVGPLVGGATYTLAIKPALRGAGGQSLAEQQVQFTTQAAALSLTAAQAGSVNLTTGGRIIEVPLAAPLVFTFSQPVSLSTFNSAFTLSGVPAAKLTFSQSPNGQTVTVQPTEALTQLTRYQYSLAAGPLGQNGQAYGGTSGTFYTELGSADQFPQISDEALLTLVQEQTFKYFWDFAHPNSGLARERNTSGNTVTIGGSGFGLMVILVGIERGFITRQQGVERLKTIVSFLARADRFHGVWPHWMHGETGQVIPFSQKDNGGDLVETAFMIQGLLTVRQYLNAANPPEAELIEAITELWETVEWDWYTRGGQNVLYWHWSPNYGWEMNHPIRGWDEALIVYVLAAASPTHPISAEVYHQGWARGGAMQNGSTYYGYRLPLGPQLGGPLFFAHYTFLGLDPRKLQDQYADYWTQNKHHTLINRAYTVQNPQRYAGYGPQLWGLTASDNHEGYSAHSPTNDLGVITPTAALSSFPYTPQESMEALKGFYYRYGNKLWGDYGFYDAFSPTHNWVASSYLAIDQGPIVIMIENHRTALLWDLFMADLEVQQGLIKLGFTYE